MKMDAIPLSTLELICLGSSVVASGLFYYIYRKKMNTVDKLKGAQKLPLNTQIVSVLNAAPEKCLKYVAIEGIVQPVGVPLKSQYKDSCLGVIQRLTLKEHKLVWNNVVRSWTESESILHQHVYTVPFNLVSPNTFTSSESERAIRVLNPLEASSLHLEMIHEKFHQAMHGFTDIVGHYLSGEKPKGVLETEEMLKIGATLTGVGELIVDRDGILKLQPPTDGSEYFLSPSGLDSIVGEQKSRAIVWQVLAAFCGLAGAAVLLSVAWRCYKQMLHKRDREERRKEFEKMRLGGQVTEKIDLEEEEEEDSCKDMCIICLSERRSCVLLYCGHVCCCFSCYQALPSPICPICRCVIERVVPLYQA